MLTSCIGVAWCVAAGNFCAIVFVADDSASRSDTERCWSSWRYAPASLTKEIFIRSSVLMASAKTARAKQARLDLKKNFSAYGGSAGPKSILRRNTLKPRTQQRRIVGFIIGLATFR